MFKFDVNDWNNNLVAIINNDGPIEGDIPEINLQNLNQNPEGAHVPGQVENINIPQAQLPAEGANIPQQINQDNNDQLLPALDPQNPQNPPFEGQGPNNIQQGNDQVIGDLNNQNIEFNPDINIIEVFIQDLLEYAIDTIIDNIIQILTNDAFLPLLQSIIYPILAVATQPELLADPALFGLLRDTATVQLPPQAEMPEQPISINEENIPIQSSSSSSSYQHPSTSNDGSTPSLNPHTNNSYTQNGTSDASTNTDISITTNQATQTNKIETCETRCQTDDYIPSK